MRWRVAALPAPAARLWASGAEPWSGRRPHGCTSWPAAGSCPASRAGSAWPRASPRGARRRCARASGSAARAFVLARLHKGVRGLFQGSGILGTLLAVDLFQHRRRPFVELGSIGLLSARRAAGEVGLRQLQGDLGHGPGLRAVAPLPAAPALPQEHGRAVEVPHPDELPRPLLQGVDLPPDRLDLRGLRRLASGSARHRATGGEEGQQRRGAHA
mmetsp:Transcript_30487/g.90360  ORF Transcript_30487/g.90360 Transcript_30487/m.90360 type:complete len:215 (-) Transcript_30487:27-671(-)